MTPIDFRDIARLVNFSRTTTVELEPLVKHDGRWSLHKAEHRVHISSAPFHILYFNASATIDDIKNAVRRTSQFAERHVVYASSLGELIKNSPELKAAFVSTAGFWSARGYVNSYIKEELGTYLARLKEQAPKDYINPRIETPAGFRRKIPNPLLGFLQDNSSSDTAGRLAIVLAEPGQGKTYMSRHLVGTIAGSASSSVPLMVDASQWETLSVEDQRHLYRTIAHSFRHFGAAISWVDGHEHEFLSATLKAELFSIVFDGFDEYILRNGGVVQPLEVLDALSTLATTTGSRILITSRTSFWETNLPQPDVNKFIEENKALVFKILEFDFETAKNYFDRRLGKEQAAKAENLYSKLRGGGHGPLVGRGFVLSLIADLAGSFRDDWSPRDAIGPVSWLVKALCERETLRQQLPYTADDQIEILRLFATEVAEGTAANTDLLRLCAADARPSLDSQTVEETIQKFKSHPLIFVDSRDGWSFKQEQVRNLLLTDQLVRWDYSRLATFASRYSLDSATWQDLASMLVELLANSYREEDVTSRLRDYIRSLSEVRGRAIGRDSSVRDHMASMLALAAVERLETKSAPRINRAQRLVYLCGGEQIESLTFSGVVASFDFRGVTFKNCAFDRVAWANCKFDDQTRFVECRFAGAIAPQHCEGFGKVRLDHCQLDPDAEAIFSSEKIKDGQRRYTADDLGNDLRSLINRFIIKGGIGLKTVESSLLVRGVIGASPHRDEIVEAVKSSLLEEHRLPNSLTAFNVKSDAAEAVKFYAANNVFTGQLREVFDELKVRLASGKAKN